MSVPRSIELMAPAGFPADPDTVGRALARLTDDFGYRVEGVEATTRRYQRFAGTDAERVAELNRYADPERPLPDIALAVRGGYGAIRLLPYLDYDGLRRRLHGQSIAFVGHSDFTAIQAALYACAGLTTFGGPMLAANFGAPTLDDFTMQQFHGVLTQPSFALHVAKPQTHAVDVAGTLWGGNLAMLAALAGTPYLPKIDGGILFVEDVNEQPFRIERMLYQLHLAGVLAKQRALVFGDFSGIKQYDTDNGYGLEQAIGQIHALTGVPVLTGLPFGHLERIATLPFGGQARLRSTQDGFELQVSDYPYRR